MNWLLHLLFSGSFRLSGSLLELMGRLRWTYFETGFFLDQIDLKEFVSMSGIRLAQWVEKGTKRAKESFQ